MRDRVPQKPGRIALTDEQTGETRYYTMTRADNPTEPGTPLNKASLLTDATCSALGLSNTATPNDAFNKLKTLVSNAQTAANNAQASANTAKTTADNAQNTANAAKNKADAGAVIKIGTFDANDLVKIEVNLSGRPKLLLVSGNNNFWVGGGQYGKSNAYIFAIYDDKEVTATLIGGFGAYIQLTDNGFTHKAFSGTAVTGSYIAFM